MILRKELELEAASWMPIQKTQMLLEECRKKGRVIFISDMYLPHSFIYPRLVELGIITGGEALYVSCEHGKTKRTGNLFKYMAEQEHTDFRHWTHYGDDWNNDYVVPQSLGIHSKLILSPYSTYERMWHDKGCLYSDYALKLYASVTRSIRLKYYPAGRDEIIPDLSAAFFVPTALRFIEELKARGIKKLFFSARDCYYMFLSAKILGGNEGIDVKYFHVSTKVLYPLLIKEATVEEIIGMLSLPDGYKPSVFLDILDVSGDARKQIAQDIDIHTVIDHDMGKTRTFAEALLRYTGHGTLAKTCGEKRRQFLEYACQEGLTPETRDAALIDLGWQGTCQHVMEQLGFSHLLFAFFGHSNSPAHLRQPNIVFDYESDKWSIFTHQFILELYVCITNEGSTTGYREKGGRWYPQREAVSISEAERQYASMAETITKEISSHLKKYTGLVNPSVKTLFDTCVMETLCRFVTDPTRRMLREMAPSLHFKHFGKKVNIIGNVSFFGYLYYCVYKLAAHLHIPLHEPEVVNYKWRLGTLTLSLGNVAKHMAKRAIELSHLIKEIKHDESIVKSSNIN